jgi:ABC-type tungstate transport system permease subunit
MKPGDLVRISDHAGYYSYQSPIGMLIEIKDEERLANPYVVLVDGELRQFNPFELAPVQTGGTHGMIGSRRI